MELRSLTRVLALQQGFQIWYYTSPCLICHQRLKACSCPKASDHLSQSNSEPPFVPRVQRVDHHASYVADPRLRLWWLPRSNRLFLVLSLCRTTTTSMNSSYAIAWLCPLISSGSTSPCQMLGYNIAHTTPHDTYKCQLTVVANDK